MIEFRCRRPCRRAVRLVLQGVATHGHKAYAGGPHPPANRDQLRGGRTDLAMRYGHDGDDGRTARGERSSEVSRSDCMGVKRTLHTRISLFLFYAILSRCSPALSFFHLLVSCMGEMRWAVPRMTSMICEALACVSLPEAFWAHNTLWGK